MKKESEKEREESRAQLEALVEENKKIREIITLT
jgi:hypothetical protein